MVDIFDEVEEDLRAERAEKLFKKYAWLIGAVVVAIVAAAAGWQLWQRWQNQQDAAAASRYVAAQNAGEQAKGEQLATLDQLAASAPQGYKTLARLRAAGLKADSGDLAGAIALWNSVAADPGADPLLRDLASLLTVQRQLDNGDPAQLEARLKPLTDPANAWSSLAQEQLAMLDLRQNKINDARRKLRLLSINLDAPAGLRARATALLAGIGGSDTQ